MNIHSIIVPPDNCKPGDLIWACSYRCNAKTHEIHDEQPTYGILLLTNHFEDEQTITVIPPTGVTFILSAYAYYQEPYRMHQPCYFAPIRDNCIQWEEIMAVSRVILAATKKDSQCIYQEKRKNNN